MNDPWKDIRDRVSTTGAYLGEAEDVERDIEQLLAAADALRDVILKTSHIEECACDECQIFWRALAALPEHLRQDPDAS